MSRIGRKPIPIPSGVEVKVDKRQVTVKGPLGGLGWTLAQGVSAEVAGGQIIIKRDSDEAKVRALHGLTRAEISNMVRGVTKGYERTLEVTGVGYKAQVQGKALSVNIGYTHPVVHNLPPGIEAKVDKQTVITLRGVDKRMVGQTGANIRGIKAPDVYKQKGIRYAGETLRKKEGKTGK
ncbi:MAG: 50S ribosomal protein L6 [Nitrospirales bacterium]